MRLYNTLSGSKDAFSPLQPDRVGIYTCGPTVYGHSHIGNFRAFAFYDLLRRHLEVSGYEVIHVMNLTDVDDKTIGGARAAGVRLAAFTGPFEVAFFDDLGSLRIKRAERYPRATEHIEDMVDLIHLLGEKGYAYKSGGDVYFRISSFPAYGSLAHLDLGGLKAGARVSQDEYDKESVSDFALWKAADDVDREVGAVWEAEFGEGRPGWHVECSVMSRFYLGQPFDIHCGGIDLLFPHHENEVAQSEAAYGVPLARCWLHVEHLADATGSKMSKSLGNIRTLRELLAEGHDAASVRYFLIASAHYRSRLRMDESAIPAAAEQVRRLRDCERRLREAEAKPPGAEDELAAQARAARAAYREALDDDLNLPQGMGQVFEAVRAANAALDAGPISPEARSELLGLLSDADAHLDVLEAGEVALEAELTGLIAQREEARTARDFALADRIRDQLRERGILLEDSKSGVRWRRG